MHSLRCNGFVFSGSSLSGIVETRLDSFVSAGSGDLIRMSSIRTIAPRCSLSISLHQAPCCSKSAFPDSLLQSYLIALRYLNRADVCCLCRSFFVVQPVDFGEAGKRGIAIRPFITNDFMTVEQTNERSLFSIYRIDLLMCLQFLKDNLLVGLL